MAVRKDVFDALGGYRSIHFSVTEDMALQLAVHNAGYGIRYAVHPSIHVETLPCTSFKEYVKQRHRWVRGGTALGIRAAIFTATSIALWLGIALSAGAGMWLHFWSFIVLRLVADSGLVFTAALLINRKRLLPMILPAMTLLMITELSLPLLATRKKVVWKNQVFRG
jgi:1,2-diacylglycerol 3-beta-glucosyltransferase